MKKILMLALLLGVFNNMYARKVNLKATVEASSEDSVVFLVNNLSGSLLDEDHWCQLTIANFRDEVIEVNPKRIRCYYENEKGKRSGIDIKSLKSLIGENKWSERFSRWTAGDIVNYQRSNAGISTSVGVAANNRGTVAARASATYNAHEAMLMNEKIDQLAASLSQQLANERQANLNTEQRYFRGGAIEPNTYSTGLLMLEEFPRKSPGTKAKIVFVIEINKKKYEHIVNIEYEKYYTAKELRNQGAW